MKPATMAEAFQATAAVAPDAVALRTVGGAVTVTWRQYAQRVRTIAAGLAGLGVGRGDTVALMLTNRPEFHLVDTAVLHLGAVPVSIYNTNPPEAIDHLFGNMANRVVITESQFVPVLRAAAELGGEVQHVICVDGAPEGTTSLTDVETNPAPGFDFDATWHAVTPEDLLTIIYTSGTTGMPKGVELTHAGVLSTVLSANDSLLNAGPGDRVLSYLPDAHLLNRCLAHYANILYGVQITTVAELAEVFAAVLECRPTVFVGVPQTWYKIKASIEQALAEAPMPLRQLATWAIGVGRQVARRRSDRTPVPLWLSLQHTLAQRLILGKLRTKLGMDRLRIALTGAAPIAADAHEFVLGLGLAVCEGWGLSEIGLATANRPDAIRIGSVGQAMVNIEIATADDGELLVRTPGVMRGYRGDPENTAETIDADGWLHTGDIGTIDDQGWVRIVDRKKELIINSSGKNMSPSNIEAAIRTNCPLVGSAVAIGDQRPHITALLVLDDELVSARYETPDDPRIAAELAAGIARANATLSRAEQIRDFTVLADVWEPGGELLTPTMKLRRKPIAERYAIQIEAMYAPNEQRARGLVQRGRQPS